MADDVSKSWSDEGTFRRAARYVLTVLGVAAVVFAIAAFWAAAHCADADSLLCDNPSEAAILIGPSAVTILGGIGAFVQTYRQWRRGKNWPIWQGAGWFLFLLTLLYLGIGGSAAGAG